MKINKKRISTIITLTVIIITSSFCKTSKEQTNNLLVGKWICISDYTSKDLKSKSYDIPLPCRFNWKFTDEQVTFINLNSEPGSRKYSFDGNTIQILDESNQFFKVYKISADSLIVTTLNKFEDEENEVSKITFLKEK